MRLVFPCQLPLRLDRSYSKVAQNTIIESVLAAKLGVSSVPLPEITTTPTEAVNEKSKRPPPELAPPTTHRDLLRHFAALLTRHGKRGEPIVAEVQRRLQLRYGVPNPVQMAIGAIKPVIKYYKSKSSRVYVPLTLYPRTAEFMAIKWIIEAARARTYVGDRPDITRGIIDEIELILQGTSSLYTKRFNTHRNPN